MSTSSEQNPNSSQALGKSDEVFRLLVESVQDYAIFLLSPDGMVMTWNAGAERIKGYSRSEIIGHHFSKFYSADARESALGAAGIGNRGLDGALQR
jgi:PAS domain S-box-containing protein